MEKPGKQQNQHYAKPETGHADPKQAESSAHVVDQGVWLGPGPDPERDGEEKRDDDRKDCQLDGRRESFLDDFDDWLAEAKRFAQVSDRGGVEKFEILHIDGLVQSPTGLGLSDVGSGGLLAEQHQGRISGCGLNQQEDEKGDQQENRDRAKQSTNQIGCHLPPIGALGSHRQRGARLAWAYSRYSWRCRRASDGATRSGPGPPR